MFATWQGRMAMLHTGVDDILPIESEYSLQGASWSHRKGVNGFLVARDNREERRGMEQQLKREEEAPRPRL